MPTKTQNPIQILLLEDNSADADIVSEYLDLARIKFELTVAKRLQEGLQLLQSKSFDVVLLDLSLPDSKGIATLNAVQEQAEDVVTIVLTGSDDDALSMEALKAGAQDYLSKDRLSSEVLQRSIRYAIERDNLTRRIEKHAKEIAHNEALLRHIFDANADAMLILTQDYEIKFFNPAAETLLEAKESNLVGEIFPFEVSTKQASELEIPESDGGLRIIELSAVDLVWEGEKALLVILSDVTMRRNTELELKREKERLSVTLDSVIDAVIATDETGSIDYMNQEASRITDISPEKAKGKALAEVLRLKNPETGKIIKDPTLELLRPGPVEKVAKSGLTLIRDDNKKPLLVTVRMRSIFDDEAQSHGSVIVLRDITKQKKAEEELFKNEKLNSISLLASGIAHDFNNMLTAVLGNISVVRMDMDGEDKHSKKLLAAETAALQAKSLTQQLLTFSKGGAPSLEVTTIDELVEESAQFILRGSNVKCEVEKEDSLWPVDADKGQISQVVNNLIINADQSMPNGGTITLRLSNRRLRHDEVPTLRAGEYVCIEVLDHGTGISPENIKRIFDPYFTTKEDGNGLGLASSYSIVRNHKGMMTVESEVGKGSSFSVFIPKTNKPVKQKEVPAQKPAESKSNLIHKGGGRILVMDDMESMMMVAGEILNALGYEVEFTTNGQEAIDAYKQAKESGNPFDAVVFDLTVPGGMGGEEASNILIEYDPDLVAIASSGYTTSNVMSDYRSSAFKAVVPKPYRIKEMSDALHRAFKGED